MIAQGWQDRLRAELKLKGFSESRASTAARLGRGYVNSILQAGKMPSIDNLAKVCTATGISLAYILFGIKMTPATAELVRLVEENPENRDAVLQLLSRRGAAE